MPSHTEASHDRLPDAAARARLWPSARQAHGRPAGEERRGAPRRRHDRCSGRRTLDGPCDSASPCTLTSSSPSRATGRERRSVARGNWSTCPDPGRRRRSSSNAARSRIGSLLPASRGTRSRAPRPRQFARPSTGRLSRSKTPSALSSRPATPRRHMSSARSSSLHRVVPPAQMPRSAATSTRRPSLELTAVPLAPPTRGTNLPALSGRSRRGSATAIASLRVLGVDRGPFDVVLSPGPGGAGGPRQGAAAPRTAGRRSTDGGNLPPQLLCL